ncbi:MAG: NAD(P)-binding protein, partial [Alphaproteobacteria bacterium]|nr:NAD(P)-binding protein [Alphaproteobacteria bacterium]
MSNDKKINITSLPRDIKKVAVIGAGAMGSTIAAHLANAGVDVHLIDMVPPGATDRNVLAKNAVERMKKATPATDPLNAGFMHPSNAKRITVGNRDDDMEEAVKDADWIVEVIIEDLDKKRELFTQIDKFKKPGAIVSSNTSTIPLQSLTDGRSADFKKNFVVTHFFNPPRFMRLLELISGPDTDPAVTKTMRDFCDIRLGKEVVICNDRPGFIANRIGTYFLFRAVSEAVDRGMKIEDVDAVLGRPMGFPKDGVFGLIDMVGLGLIPHVTKSLHTTLPASDMFQDIYREEKLITAMLADGRWGRNSGKGGFYRMQRQEDGSKVLEAIDLKTGQYRPKVESKLASVKAGKEGPRATLETKDIGGEFAWEVMRDTLVYALSLVPEVSDDIAAIDAAMREGYNWKYGPFELVDRIGKDWFATKLAREGIAIPPALKLANGDPFFKTEKGVQHRMVFDFAANTAVYKPIEKPEGVLSLATLKATRKPLLTNRSASLWDIGDGVTCLEFHSKGNTLDPLIFKLINDSIELVNDSKGKYKAMVVYNDDKDFSLGANLGLAAAGFKAAASPHAKRFGLTGPIENRVYKMLEEFIYEGQATYKALRYAPFPVIGAPAGMAFGGGCEIL